MEREEKISLVEIKKKLLAISSAGLMIGTKEYIRGVVKDIIDFQTQQTTLYAIRDKVSKEYLHMGHLNKELEGEFAFSTVVDAEREIEHCQSLGDYEDCHFEIIYLHVTVGTPIAEGEEDEG